eukprot:1141245-Pelagomonas_calceolata.AAC.1
MGPSLSSNPSFNFSSGTMVNTEFDLQPLVGSLAPRPAQLFQPHTKMSMSSKTPDMLSIFKGLLGGSLLGARRWRMGEGKFGRPGAWRTTLSIPISSVPGSRLG